MWVRQLTRAADFCPMPQAHSTCKQMLSATLEIQTGYGFIDMKGESGETSCFFPSFLFILDFI